MRQKNNPFGSGRINSSISQESVTSTLVPGNTSTSYFQLLPATRGRGRQMREPAAKLSSYLSDIMLETPGPSSADAADSDSPQNGNTCRKRKINENRKNISEIWNYFKRVSATHCQCNLCPNVYVISGTGTMRTHLKTKHKIVLVSKQITSTDANLNQQINLTEIIKPLLIQDNESMDGGHEEDENDEDIDDLVQLPQSQPANSKTSKTVPAETKPASLNGSSSIFRRRKKSLNKRSNTSKIWNHFKRISATHCKCNYCPRAYVVSSGTGTLRTHLKTKHNSIFLKIQNTLVSDTPIHSNPNATNKPRRQNNDDAQQPSDAFQYNEARAKEALAHFVYMGGHSFSVPSEQAFVEFCQTLQPNFIPPCQTTLQSMVMESFTTLKNHVISFLQSGDNSKFSFTTNIWPSPNNKYARIGVTISWMNTAFEFFDIVIGFRDIFGEDNGINICNTFLEIANEFKLVDKMFCVTTDNASSSNVAFIDYLVLLTFNEENSLLIEFWIHCLGNIVNTAIQDSLTTMKPFFEKLRRLVSDIRASPQRMEQFKEIIKTVNGKETSDHFNLGCTEEDVCIAEDDLPILDVEWKWSSTYMLLGRSKELRPALDEIASNNDDFKENQLSSTEWEGIDSVFEFLQPFAKALKYVEGVKNPSLPVVVPLYNHLLKKAQDFANCMSNPELVRKGAVLACKKMSNHSPMLDVVTAMDPRMKYKYFNETASSADRNTLETVVKPALKKLWNKYKNLPVENEPTEDPIRPMDGLLDDMFPQESEEMDELEQYLSESCERRDTDIIAYWRFKSARWPRLARMARDIHAAQATSATYKRGFVTSERDVFGSSNRMKLKAETVEASVCLRSWMKSGIVDRREATTMLEILIHTDGSDNDA